MGETGIEERISMTTMKYCFFRMNIEDKSADSLNDPSQTPP